MVGLSNKEKESSGKKKTHKIYSHKRENRKETKGFL